MARPGDIVVRDIPRTSWNDQYIEISVVRRATNGVIIEARLLCSTRDVLRRWQEPNMHLMFHLQNHLKEIVHLNYGY